jgi:hypothetical protein
MAPSYAATIEKEKQQVGAWGKADELADMKARHAEVINQLKPKAKSKRRRLRRMQRFRPSYRSSARSRSLR